MSQACKEAGIAEQTVVTLHSIHELATLIFQYFFLQSNCAEIRDICIQTADNMRDEVFPRFECSVTTVCPHASLVDLEAQLWRVQVATEEDGLAGPSQLGERFVNGMLHMGATEATRSILGVGGTQFQCDRTFTHVAYHDKCRILFS